MARQRYYRPWVRCCRVLRVSADRAARPSPHPRKTAASRRRKANPARDRFAPDSPLEGAGFEPSVPLEVLAVRIVPCRLRGPFHASLPKTKFAADSALEEDGFEPPVPLGSNTSVSTGFAGWRGGRSLFRKAPVLGGTGSSNPSSSSGESFRLARSIGSQTTFAPRAGSVSSNANRAKHPAVPRPYLGVGDWILPRTRASACMC